MHAYKLNVNVAEDHRLAVHLPADFPAGPAEVIVLAVPRVERKLVKVMGSLGGAAAVPADADPVADALCELRGLRLVTKDGIIHGSGLVATIWDS